MNILSNQYIYYQDLIPTLYHGFIINVNNIISNNSIYQSMSDMTYNGGSDQTSSPRSCIYWKNNKYPSVKFGLLSVVSSGAFEESSYSTSQNLAFRIKLNDNTSISPYQQNTNIPSYIYNEYIKLFISETENSLIIYLSGLIIFTGILEYRGNINIISFAYNTGKDSYTTLNKKYSYIYVLNNQYYGNNTEIVLKDTNLSIPTIIYDPTDYILNLNKIYPTIKHVDSRYLIIPVEINDLYTINSLYNIEPSVNDIIEFNQDRYISLGGSEMFVVKI